LIATYLCRYTLVLIIFFVIVCFVVILVVIVDVVQESLDFFWVFVGGEDVALLVVDDVADVAGFVEGEFADVAAGDLQVVEHACGAPGFETVLAEGGEHHRERKLDGVGVFERGEGEFERASGVGVVFGEERLAVDLVDLIGGDGIDGVGGAVVWRTKGAETRVDALVVVAEGLVAERGRLAAATAGTDVAAVGGWHNDLFWFSDRVLVVSG
jgi:hypothetical protein